MNPCCRRGPGSIGGAPAGWTPSKAADRRWAVIGDGDSPRGAVDPGSASAALGRLLAGLREELVERRGLAADDRGERAVPHEVAPVLDALARRADHRGLADAERCGGGDDRRR